MITITLTRIKKAFLHPKAAFLYFKSYLEGEFLRFASKRKIYLKKELSKRVYFEQSEKQGSGAKRTGSYFEQSEKQDSLEQSERDSYINLEKHFFKRKEPRFFEKGFLEELANQNFIIDNADRVCNNEFAFLGINPKVLKNIYWNQDIKSGHTWPDIFYLDLREKFIKDYNKGWDIKMVWELSRFQYAVPLALAFYKTGEEKYLKKWQELILDWIEKNPVYFGPNWINAMEAAIRVCNWIFSWEIIIARNKKQETKNNLEKKFLEKFLSSLVEHGKFIYRNLEYAPMRSNHYLSDIVGLVYLGIMFPEFKESKKWLKKGLRALEEEMKFQIYNDGVDYELSISYHRYVTELFLWTGRLCMMNNINLSLEFWKKLEKMVEFSRYYTKPNGFAPQIGDSDDGRLHIVWEDFYNWKKRNHFALFKLSDYIFSNKNVIASEALVDSKSFSEGGLYIMRDKDFYLITGRNRCCYGKGGSHIHNDILSFELSMFGDDFIIDSGTYVYTSDFKERNRFRKTKAHNTVLIDHQEQNPISKDPFYIEQTGELIVNKWGIEEEQIILDAEHNCYKRLRCPVIHNRLFCFDKKKRILDIKDKFRGKGDHELEWNFHLSPEVKVWLKEEKPDQKEIILIRNDGSLVFSAPKILNCVIIEDKVSPSYGIKVPAKTIRFTGFLKQGFPREYKFSFRPLK